MSEAGNDKVSCPDCGKKFRWKAEYADRSVRCTCGRVMRMPPSLPKPARQPEPAPDDTGGGYELEDGYELDMPHTPKATTVAFTAESGKCPNCNQPIKPDAVICIKCGFNLHAGEKVETKTLIDDEPHDSGAPAGLGGFALGGATQLSAGARRAEERERAALAQAHSARFKDYFIPIILVAIGVVLFAVNAFALEDFTAFAAAGAQGSPIVWRATTFVVQLLLTLLYIPFLLIAIFLTAKIFGSGYGTLFAGLLKLMAIVLFSSGLRIAIDSAIAIGFDGHSPWFFTAFIQWCAFFILAMWLFEMDFLESCILYLLGVFVPSFLVVLGMIVLMSALF